MLTPEHLERAVANGVITSEQAVALLGLAEGAASSARARAGDYPGEPGEERFRIANGFNEVFVALGVVLLAFGMFASLGGGLAGTASIADLSRSGLLALGFTVVLWLICEYLTGRRRMLAPSIVLVIAMCAMALPASVPIIKLLGVEFSRGRQMSVVPWQMVVFPVSALVVSGLHYLRFQFPFSLQIVAASLIGVIAVGLSVIAPDFALMNYTRIMFVFGLAVFAAAMAFDLSDPMRRTNRSDCGFWLHMAAAPLIVHPLMPNGLDGAGVVFAIFAVLALVAIIVDRRAILVASLSYLMAAIGYLAARRGVNVAQIYFMIPLLVGAGIIALGTGWQAVRRGVWSALPRLGVMERLRPAMK